MPNEIVYYDSSQTGAPVLNNANGALVGLLDACLVNGFNSKSVTSIVVASGIATVTVSAHGYVAGAGRMLDLAGVTGGPTGFALLNGRKKVLTIGSANTFTVDATGVSPGTATGTITCKVSPLGWVKQYSGTNKAMYRRSDVAATAMLLRIDDTGAGIAAATYARALMVETASDVDTYTGPAPTVAQLAGPGQYWSKGANSAGAKNWVLVGDGRTFYFFSEDPSYAFANFGLCAMGFGDLVSYRASDPYRAFIAGPFQVGLNTCAFNTSPITIAPSNASAVVSRPYSQIGTAVFLGAVSASASTQVPGSAGPVFPSPVDNGLILQRPLVVIELSVPFSNPPRGEYPGVALALANVGNVLDRVVLNNPIGFTGDLLSVAVVAGGTKGCMFFDLTGPWQV